MSTTQNETQGIAETIRTTLNGRGQSSYYDQYARPVVEALNTRETGLSEQLLDFAVDQGADRDEVKEFLRGIGMAVATDPEPEPEAAATSDESEEDILTRIDANLRSLTATVTSLADFARRNGYRG